MNPPASKAIELTENTEEIELKYYNYSVVMHSARKLAIFSAANLDGAHRYSLNRIKDIWRIDPRIPAEMQLTSRFYEGNKFDRGHLTRREDLEYGTSPVKAVQSANDTCHWSNCTPQHEKFNRNTELWQGIERHLLEKSIEADLFKAHVFTGPVFTDKDPVFEGFHFPLRFWKVVATVNGKGKLFATAYVLDQSAVIAQFGLREASVEPFTAYKTFQVKIAEAEKLTGLSFTSGKNSSLRSVDPLHAVSHPRQKETHLEKDAAPEGYVLLSSFADMVHLD